MGKKARRRLTRGFSVGPHKLFTAEKRHKCGDEVKLITGKVGDGADLERYLSPWEWEFCPTYMKAVRFKENGSTEATRSHM